MKRTVILVCVVFVLLQMPLIPFGYGTDYDAWRIVKTAIGTASHGGYAASRFPGYPIPELTYALLIRLGLTTPMLLNGMTILMSLIGLVVFWRLSRALHLPHAGAALVAFAFAPSLLLVAGTTMDYVWALTFILCAWLAAVHKRPALAGLLLGIAIGCRITSALGILPLAFWLWREQDNRAVMRMVLATVVSAFICWLPVLLTYGLSFWRFYNDDLGFPVQTIIYRGFIEPLGSVGFAALVVFVIVFGLRRRLKARSASLSVACLMMIGMEALVFLRLPHETAYMLPAVPFTLLLIWNVFPARALRIVSLFMVISGLLYLSDLYPSRMNFKPLPSLVIELDRNTTMEDGG